MELSERLEMLSSTNRWGFSDLRALYINCTQKRSPELSHTQGLIGRSIEITTWNLVHLARLIRDTGDIPSHGNQRSLGDAECRFDYPDPEHR